jgi:hypothetical protein
MGALLGLSRTLYTLEEAWRDNKTGISCIPAGTYKCVPHGWEPNSKVTKPKTWRLENVPGRFAVLIHIGNYTKDTEGCILAGMGMSVSQTLAMVSDSAMAVGLMRKEIGASGFTLTIKNLVGPSVA